MNSKGRELDVLIAREVLGFDVEKHKKWGYVETTPDGQRPLPHYSTDIKAAWEVADAIGISLLPIEDGSWFALIGPKRGWTTPSEFFSYMQDGQFKKGGAAVAETASMAICLAAVRTTKNPGVFKEKPRTSAAEDTIAPGSVTQEPRLEIVTPPRPIKH